MNSINKSENWDLIIKPTSRFFSLNLREIWRYRDLIVLFCRRDMVSQYKQTVLGPLWLIIQPILSTAFFSIIFGGFAKFDSGSIPYPVYTLSGLTIWNFFSTSLSKTSSVFVANSAIFGKVYFPRLTVPVSIIISNSISFGIQLIVLLTVLVYYKTAMDYSWRINPEILVTFPLLLVLCASLGMGFGLIASSLTTKYRDLTFLISFSLQFAMYFSAVVFPLGKFSATVQTILSINPMLHIVGLFRSIFLSTPVPSLFWLIYSLIFSLIILFAGMLIFNKVEKSFMDTV